MAQKTINVGTGANTGGGDPLRNAMIKINDNFTELYADIAALEDGDITTDIKGSVFADDSTLLVDGVNGKVVGDVDNIEVVTTTVQGRDSANLNIYRGTSGTVSLGDASSGNVTVSDSGINITSTAGVSINGAATGTVEIGTGATTGNVTIGKVGNTTTINGNISASNISATAKFLVPTMSTASYTGNADLEVAGSIVYDTDQNRYFGYRAGVGWFQLD